ncbi:MAG: stage V sporulation T C-terminal domain-containing protein [Eubacteriales bacterium]|nr:stage V sporulation T C-terminal domain-containing protein [Eubacteriales bacterium]MDD4474569.1 stage V sporulation T C-terminal domain-containing protein [Eubacteriales bacterium]
MKATGIVRRIDDLGRVVIPKEIRRTLRIREGDPLEIFTDKGGEVVFKKYSPVGELGKFAAEFAESIYKVNGIPTLVCDKDTIISAVGVSRRDFLEKPLNPKITEIIEKREPYVSNGNSFEAVENSGKNVLSVSPIVSEGTPIGALIALSGGDNENAGDSAIKIMNTAAEFLSKQIEY